LIFFIKGRRAKLFFAAKVRGFSIEERKSSIDIVTSVKLMKGYFCKTVTKSRQRFKQKGYKMNCKGCRQAIG
jgi:hypothetical protein